MNDILGILLNNGVLILTDFLSVDMCMTLQIEVALVLGYCLPLCQLV